MITGIPGSMPGTPDWQALRFYDPQRPFRPVIFGASEAAKALGQSPYGGPLDLYLEKRREKPPRESTEEMKLGLLLEPVVLAHYAEQRSLRLIAPLPMYFHPQHPFMGATPDAVTEDHDRGVDAKTSTWRMYDASGQDPHKYGEEGTDQLPVDYVLQGQQQIEVTGLPYIEFPVLMDRRLKVYRVHREPTLIEALIKAEKELAERIINADPPEPNWTAENSRELIRCLYGLSANKVVTLSEEAIEHWANVQRWKAEMTRLDAQMREAKAKILWEMQDAQMARYPRGSVELARIIVPETRYTDGDVEEVRARIGQVKRKGHEQFRERKVKS